MLAGCHLTLWPVTKYHAAARVVVFGASSETGEETLCIVLSVAERWQMARHFAQIADRHLRLPLWRRVRR